MQTEEFAGRKPIFLAGLECLLRLADHLKLIVAEKLFQGSLDACQFWRNRLWLCDIFRDDESTPDRLCAPQSRDRAEDEGRKDGDRKSTRLNSSQTVCSYDFFFLKHKQHDTANEDRRYR